MFNVERMPVSYIHNHEYEQYSCIKYKDINNVAATVKIASIVPVLEIRDISLTRKLILDPYINSTLSNSLVGDYLFCQDFTMLKSNLPPPFL